MTKSAKIFFGLYVLGSLIALLYNQANAASQDARKELIKGYTGWTLVTPNPVDMAPHVALLCRPSPEHNPPNPHLPRYFRVYVNEAGKKAMFAPEPIFPVGSVIVKEKYQTKPTASVVEPKPKLGPDPKLELLTVMVKRAKGFDPKNGDWEYFTCDGNGTPNDRSLSVNHCKSCHLAKKSSDFVFRSYGSRSN